ncbi:MAG: hypothetical protein ACYTFY_13595 [Planctomycetota bacterium]|jgi:hypothetical protein
MYNILDTNRFGVFCLSCNCPVEKDNKDCPFLEFRNLPIEICDNIIQTMSTEEIMRLQNYHEFCVSS